MTYERDTAHSVEDETRNAELNGNRNPEWWGNWVQASNPHLKRRGKILNLVHRLGSKSIEVQICSIYRM